MRALTDMQRAFVLALVQGNTPERPSIAAKVAGYSDASVSAHQLMRSRKVLAAIREEADQRFGACLLIGFKALVDIANDPQHKQRLQAGIKLLEYAGLQVVAKQEIVVKDNRIETMTVEQLMLELRDSAKRLGLVKPEDFAQNAIEGEFAEVQPLQSDDFDFTIQPGEFPIDGQAGHLRSEGVSAGEACRDDSLAPGPGVQLEPDERVNGSGD